MKDIKIYDTTLRDGSQMRGIKFSVEDKLKIIKKLDKSGIHYIECGWPSSNLTDKELFEKLGGFDEKYFMYFEDVDFCCRARKTGNKVKK